MPSRTNINSPITYIITIYPFADNNRTTTITVSNSIISGIAVSGFYQLESFSFHNDIFDPIQSGTAKVIQTQYATIDFFKYVKEGDLLFISEQSPNKSLGDNIFSGYVESLQLDIDASGSVITLNFANLIKQISISKIFGNIVNTIQTAESFVFQTFLNSIVANTLISKSVLKSGNNNFQFQAGSNENDNTILSGTNTIYVTITSYMTILQAINKIIFPYQRYIYQDSTGTIVISPLSLFNDFSWQFDQRNGNDIANFIPYTNLTVKKNAGSSFNQAYGTLFSIPIALSTADVLKFQQSGFATVFTPSPTYFNRLNQLYNSGNFTMTDITIEDVIADPNKLDQTLINISNIVQGLNVASSIASTISVVNQTPIQFPTQTPLHSNQGNSDVSAILYNYVARTMSEAIVDETQVFVSTPRITQTDVNGNLLPLPINQIVNVNMDDGILDKSALFCRGYHLSYSSSGTMVTLNLCKPLSGGAYWVNGELVDVD